MRKRLPHVLIVDDDMQTLKTMSAYLLGTARVATALGARQALDYVHQNSVDLILLDVEMPIMDGFKTLEQFQKIEECINVPVVLVTGRRDKTTILNSSMMGVDGYLAKPVDKETLVNKVREICDSREIKQDKKTVLMIDDDMSYLKQVNSLLKDNYNVIMINSAKLALNYLISHTPDIILLDYQMPLYNGANVMNMIQKNNPNKRIPVIILSSALNREALADCYAYSPAGYLVKPASKEVLIDNIEKVLNNKG
jgi:CheY-like chemotaxis protein